MTGGSIVRKVRGGADNAADFNIPYVAAIRERIGHRVPIVMITESQPMDRLRRMRDDYKARQAAKAKPTTAGTNAPTEGDDEF